jgi:transcriptional regulator with XRE-family HTH domain
METNNIISQLWEQIRNDDIEKFVDITMDVIEEVHAILEKKNWTQNDLALQLDKSPAEVSKWLSSSHNLTIKSIAKLSVALNEDLIMTVSKAKEKFQNNEPIIKVVTVIKTVHVALPQYGVSEKSDLQIVYKIPA